MRRSPGTVSLMRSSPPVTPASAMKLPISMWSGATWCSQPCRRSAPSTVMTLEPMPWMSAPIFTSMRATSWTCGSQAALPMTVVPGVRAAAISAFSVAITDGSSMNTSVGRRPRGALRTISPSQSVCAPIARNASRCGSRRRRPMTSPPGGGITARPKRASSGPASRNDALIDSASSRSIDTSCTFAAHSTTSLGRRQLTSTPIAARISSIASTSRMRGTLQTTTSSSVRTLAARIGSAPFLLPAGTIVPDSGTPPSMTNFSMSFRRRPPVNEDPPDPPVERLASVTAMSCGVRVRTRGPCFCRGTAPAQASTDAYATSLAARSCLDRTSRAKSSRYTSYVQTFG